MAADVATSLKDWSTTATSNAPSGSTAISTNLDDNLRQIQTVVRYLAASDTIASATTTDIGTKDAAFLTVSGTTTITGLGTVSAGIYKWVVFSGALTLTHNATSLILPTAGNITTAAGDTALFLSLGSGNWRCLSYAKANGTALSTTAPAFADGTVSAPSVYFASDTNTGIYRIGSDNLGIAAGGSKIVDVSTAGAAVTGTLSSSSTLSTSTSVTATQGIQSSQSGSFKSYRFASDTDTYITSAAANTISIVAGESGTSAEVNISALGSTNGTVYVTAKGAHSLGYSGVKIKDETISSGTLSAAASLMVDTTMASASAGSVFLLRSDVNSTPIPLLEVTSNGSMSLNTDRAAGTGFNMLGITASITGTPNLVFRVRGDGATFADGAYSSSGADYAEAFPYTGTQPQPGDTVTLDGDKVRLATQGDEVIGVISSKPAVIGDQKLVDQGGVVVGLVGKLKVNPGCPVDSRWRLLDAQNNVYLVR